jgi:starch phosphorylase
MLITTLESLPNEIETQYPAEKPDFLAFLKRIDREDLAEVITDKTPWLYFSQEIYREKEFGIQGGGGLGVLAGDMTRIAENIGLPLVVVTPFYSQKTHQALFDFGHSDSLEAVAPQNYGFQNMGTIEISTKTYSSVPLEIHAKRRGSMRIVTLYEPNIGPLYSGESGSDHRLYHEVLSGFGGYQVIKKSNLDPPLIQMNEAPTVFAAIAKLDDLCSQGIDFDTALDKVRTLTIYTNHTLLPAAEGEFHYSQFESLVFPNIKNKSVIDWVSWQFTQDSKIKLSTLAIELSYKKNGVSKLHAKISSENYKNRDGGAVEFAAVTNGISNHWISPEFVEVYDKIGILDEFGLPTENYTELLENLSADTIRNIKLNTKKQMNNILSRRQDQYGNPVHIPDDTKIIDIKRRLVGYKRAKMIFNDPGRLINILNTHNAHVIISGKPHSGDYMMVNDLRQILIMVDSNPALKERVHYIQNYDEEVSLALAVGGDCSINVPIVGQEACGTSWMKDIANCKVLISTIDGGAADIEPPAYLEVTGSSYSEEADMLYRQMEQACNIIDDDEQLKNQVTKQLQAYLPIISGSRMIKDYLNLRFPKDASADIEE